MEAFSSSIPQQQTGNLSFLGNPRSASVPRGSCRVLLRAAAKPTCLPQAGTPGAEATAHLSFFRPFPQPASEPQATQLRSWRTFRYPLSYTLR